MSRKCKTKKQLLKLLNETFEEVKIELEKITKKSPFTEKIENHISYKYGEIIADYTVIQQMIEWVEDLEEIK